MNLEPISISHEQMNLILMAVEHGFREHERGSNLQGALASVFKLYRIAPPPAALNIHQRADRGGIEK